MQINAVTPRRIVDTIEDLEALVEQGNQLVGQKGIELQLLGLSEEENQKYQEIINSHLTACGCNEGKIALGTLVLTYALYLALRPEGFHNLGWDEFGIGFALACLGALLGKVYGLLIAKRRTVAVLRDLRLHLRGSGTEIGVTRRCESES